MTVESASESTAADRRVGRIPVRNLWLLMLYASDLAKTGGVLRALSEDDIDDLPDLVARLLIEEVQRRLRRNLTRGYRQFERPLSRVRGRVNLLITESRQLLSRGEVHCRFSELTFNTPRNRLVLAALNALTRRGMIRNPETVSRCKSVALSMARAGVDSFRPSTAELMGDQLGRNDAADRLMVALAQLALDFAIPSEEAGSLSLLAPDRSEQWVRKLFEKAVLGFVRVELEPLGWRVPGPISLDWQISDESAGMSAILPSMKTDIVLDPPDPAPRLVIDTKFTSVLTKGRFGNDSLKSGYVYQMYAYLRSQEGLQACWEDASGLFLHPAIDCSIRERVTIQGHTITFATVDLSARPSVIRQELRSILLSLR